MNSAEQTTSQQASTLLSATAPVGRGARAPVRPLSRLRVRHLALGAVMALSAVMNTYRLSQNGWANVFYSAGVKSMLRSFHNFVFVSFDPGGLITIDKPPLGLWVQAVSAKLFGFTPLSLLLPEAIMGMVAVAVLYWAVTPCFGATAGIASALALALFPSFVAVSRDNNVDALLILLMTLASAFGLRAIAGGRLRWLLGCAVLVGLAFNTKTLAAYLVVPGLALGYLLCAPAPLARRALHLLAAGCLLLVVSGAWIALVELTPASKRPFVGGSTDNTELGLTFGYNGFGRVGGQLGGPGQIRVVLKHGSLADAEKEALLLQSQGKTIPGTTPGLPPAPHHPGARPHPRKPPSKFLPDGRAREPTAFGGPTGPLRLFGLALGSQGAWMLPFGLVGLLALALWSLVPAASAPRRRRAARGRAPAAEGDTDELEIPASTAAGATVAAGGGGRRDPRVAGLIVLGGWFLAEFVVLSFSKGIVHPYYLSALGPGLAAMVGAGAVAFVAPGPRRSWRLALLPLAVAGTVAAQLVLLREDQRYLHWFWPLLIAGAAAGAVAILLLSLRRRGPAAAVAMALTLGVLLIVPAVYAASTWRFRVEATFPAAGPHAAGGYPGVGVDANSTRVTKALLAYLRTRHPGKRWIVLTEASDTAAPMILLGYNAAAMGGYSGYDPALDGRQLAEMVRRGEARYAVLGGAYAERGGNAASTAVLHACKVIPGAAWQPPPANPNALLLFDCKGREAQLSRQPDTVEEDGT
ncbi:MAG TPA: glycosyltransferase family 39 protein [Solirubrobacteraceae bacterium]|nr:glycosyltransferase family 39 protein [Solirubrobacteraceae bacterium]